MTQTFDNGKESKNSRKPPIDPKQAFGEKELTSTSGPAMGKEKASALLSLHVDRNRTLHEWGRSMMDDGYRVDESDLKRRLSYPKLPESVVLDAIASANKENLRVRALLTELSGESFSDVNCGKSQYESVREAAKNALEKSVMDTLQKVFQPGSQSVYSVLDAIARSDKTDLEVITLLKKMTEIESITVSTAAKKALEQSQ